MFFKVSKSLPPKEIKFEESIGLDDKHKTLQIINILHNKNKVGEIICIGRADGDIDVSWLEVEEKFQGYGIASQAMNYLCQKAINEAKALIINVVDESVLDNFYLNWFSKRVNPDGDYDKDIVTDYFNQLISIEDDKYFNSNHPTLILKPENISWVPTEVDELKPLPN